tara:strand:- start:309 stop:611 length:303 start_codon:yes stop_codon:yes gene_type:complete
MEKVVIDGNVLVLYSPGYGAGFYTWDAPAEAVFDPKLIKLVKDENIEEAISYAEKTYDVYAGGVEDLKIASIPEGTKFIINEYDGYESIQLLDSIDYLTA